MKPRIGTVEKRSVPAGCASFGPSLAWQGSRIMEFPVATKIQAPPPEIRGSMRTRRMPFRSWTLLFLFPFLGFTPTRSAAGPSLDPALSDWIAAARAPSRTAMSILPEWADTEEPGGPWVDLLVRGEVSALEIERLGGNVRTVAGAIRTVHLPVSALASFV